MEIPAKGPLHSVQALNRLSEALPQPPIEAAGAQRRAAEKDTISLTKNGREFKAAVAHSHVLPEIREDRVLRLKRQLEEGSYRIKGHRIAVNMINETLENNNILKQIDTNA